MKAFWGVGTNVGDTLTPAILDYFTPYKAKWVSSLYDGKLLMCGSILEYARPGDTILGAGHYKNEVIDLSQMNVLALRGMNSGSADFYGDPAILLPLMYNPTVYKKKPLGFVPHIWEQKNYTNYIDVNLPWKKFVREILSCEHIISTSLHGIIIADAYGIPYTWVESNIVPGAKIKYEDYLSGIKDGIDNARSGLVKAMEML